MGYGDYKSLLDHAEVVRGVFYGPRLSYIQCSLYRDTTATIDVTD